MEVLLARTRKIFRALEIIQERFNQHVFIQEDQIFSVSLDTIEDDHNDTNVLRVDFPPSLKRYLIIYQEDVYRGRVHDTLRFEEWHKGEVVFKENYRHDRNDQDYSFLWDQ